MCGTDLHFFVLHLKAELLNKQIFFFFLIFLIILINNLVLFWGNQIQMANKINDYQQPDFWNFIFTKDHCNIRFLTLQIWINQIKNLGWFLYFESWIKIMIRHPNKKCVTYQRVDSLCTILYEHLRLTDSWTQNAWNIKRHTKPIRGKSDYCWS
jgi:hypothetical protein